MVPARLWAAEEPAHPGPTVSAEAVEEVSVAAAAAALEAVVAAVSAAAVGEASAVVAVAALAAAVEAASVEAAAADLADAAETVIYFKKQCRDRDLESKSPGPCFVLCVPAKENSLAFVRTDSCMRG